MQVRELLNHTYIDLMILSGPGRDYITEESNISMTSVQEKTCLLRTTSLSAVSLNSCHDIH